MSEATMPNNNIVPMPTAPTAPKARRKRNRNTSDAGEMRRLILARFMAPVAGAIAEDVLEDGASGVGRLAAHLGTLDAALHAWARAHELDQRPIPRSKIEGMFPKPKAKNEKMSPDDESRIVACYLAGKTAREVAAECARGVSSVLRVLKSRAKTDPAVAKRLAEGKAGGPRPAGVDALTAGARKLSPEERAKLLAVLATMAAQS